MNFIQSKKIFLTLVIVTLVYSVLAFVVLPSESFFAGDEGVKFIQTQSLVKHHYRAFFLSYPGKELDPHNKFFPIAAPYAVGRDGKMYSQWPILFPLFSSFFLKWFGQRGLYVIPVISSLLTLLVISKISRLLFKKDLTFILLVLAFSTPVFFYSLVFWEHTLSLLLSTLAVYLILLVLEREQGKWALLAGLSLGLGIWVRNELYFFALSLVVAALATRAVQSKKLAYSAVGYFFMGIFLVLFPMWIVQKLTLGEFLGADVSQFTKSAVFTEASPFKASIFSFLTYKVKLAAVLLFHRFKREWMVVLVLPYLLFALIAIFPRLRKRKFLLISTLLAMAAVSLFVLSQDLLNSGLLVNTPFVIFSLTALAVGGRPGKAERMTRFVVLAGLAYVIMISLLAPATGGMQWGPRFMLPAIPLLLVASARLWDNWREPIWPHRRIVKSTLVLLILVSFFVQIRGIQYLYRDRQEGARLVARIGQRPERVFITDNFWFPQETAVLYEGKKFYFVGKRADFKALAARLHESGIKRFAFVTLARTSHIGRVTGFAGKEKLLLPGNFLLESFEVE